MKKQDFLRQITIGQEQYDFYDINLLNGKGTSIQSLPFSIRVLIENLLRNLDGKIVLEEDLVNIRGWQKRYKDPVEIPFHPGRVLMQDFTGVPAVADLAAMRDAIERLGGDPQKINPLVPVELIVDHSIQVDYYGTLTPLDQMASLSVPESRLITIQPWDVSGIKGIEKAILASSLGLTPSSDGKLIRIAIPPLTEERRKELVKVVNQMCEDHKVLIWLTGIIPKSRK